MLRDQSQLAFLLQAEQAIQLQVGRWITVASKDGRELTGRAMAYHYSSSGVNIFMMRIIMQQHGNTKIYISYCYTHPKTSVTVHSFPIELPIRVVLHMTPYILEDDDTVSRSQHSMDDSSTSDNALNDPTTRRPPSTESLSVYNCCVVFVESSCLR